MRASAAVRSDVAVLALKLELAVEAFVAAVEMGESNGTTSVSAVVEASWLTLIVGSMVSSDASRTHESNDEEGGALYLDRSISISIRLSIYRSIYLSTQEPPCFQTDSR